MKHRGFNTKAVMCRVVRGVSVRCQWFDCRNKGTIDISVARDVTLISPRFLHPLLPRRPHIITLSFILRDCRGRCPVLPPWPAHPSAPDPERTGAILARSCALPGMSCRIRRPG